MSGKKKLFYFLNAIKCGKNCFNIDFENGIPCINLFLMYILNFSMVHR